MAHAYSPWLVESQIVASNPHISRLHNVHIVSIISAQDRAQALKSSPAPSILIDAHEAQAAFIQDIIAGLAGTGSAEAAVASTTSICTQAKLRASQNDPKIGTVFVIGHFLIINGKNNAS